jgi:acyl-CoA reductase-like NAD-dependent aldehyde dehydrogenase
MRSVPHFIAGRRQSGAGERAGPVFDPNTCKVQTEVAFAADRELDAAVANAAAA